MALVKLFAGLREAAGVATDEIDASTVGELVEEASRRYGERFEESLRFSNVAVNGTLVSHLGGNATPIEASDEVAFLPPVSGGGDERPVRWALREHHASG